MRTVSRLPSAIIVVIMSLLAIGTPARAAETILYDVTTLNFMFFTAPTLTSTTERIQITDRGPQTDGSPRWTTESLGSVAVWDEPGSESAPDNLLFGNSCEEVPTFTGARLPRRVQVNAASGGGNFAWINGLSPDGTIDNYAAFCLKWSHQSTTTWSEQVSIGRRVYAAPPPPPPSPVKVFITQPKAGATVSGTVWVVIWVEGTSGSSNIFTLKADGTDVSTQNAGSSKGPVTIPWNSKAGLNGTHTLTATVKDATGATGSASISVIVNNP